MLQEFLATHRNAIIARVRARAIVRRVPLATAEDLETGVPLFLDQLASALQRDDGAVPTEVAASASQHATALLLQGFSVSQVVHGYGDVCQVVTGLAIELDEPIATTEFRTLNLCLDEAIAGAVTEYGRLRETALTDVSSERLGFLADEARHLLGSADLSFDLLRAGTVPIGGSTGAILGRSLARLRTLVDRLFAEARLDSGIARDRIPIAELLEEVEVTATASAKARRIRLCVNRGELHAATLGDRHLLFSTIDHLVQNAMTYTPPEGDVRVAARVEGDVVVIEVADACGGISEDVVERMFAPRDQRKPKSSGLGLGLTIGRRSVRAMDGEITVHDVAGKGCVFTVRVPRAP